MRLVALYVQRLLGLPLCCLFLANSALAQNAPSSAAGLPAAPAAEITVATRIVAPFVIKDGEGFSGFSVDLWNAIGAELGVKSRFVRYEKLSDLLAAVSDGRHEAGIAAISINSERAKTLDFSVPMFRSGLSIMVPSDAQKLNMLGLMFSSGMLKATGIFLLVLIIPAHIIWFLARGRDDGLPISEKYIPGIFDAVFWCAESMGGAAQAHPTRIFARVAAIVWIYAGIVLISYFTAFATTSLTLQTLKGEINGPGDLRGKRLAVVEGSTSANYAKELGAILGSYGNFDAAAEAVLGAKADAAIYDTPVIMHYTKNEPRALIAGPQFRHERYGIVLPIGGSLRRPVNQALLKLYENGTYASLYRKWFGQEGDGG